MPATLIPVASAWLKYCDEAETKFAQLVTAAKPPPGGETNVTVLLFVRLVTLPVASASVLSRLKNEPRLVWRPRLPPPAAL